jgi:hypothetical protein
LTPHILLERMAAKVGYNKVRELSWRPVKGTHFSKGQSSNPQTEFLRPDPCITLIEASQGFILWQGLHNLISQTGMDSPYSSSNSIGIQKFPCMNTRYLLSF